jgi:hypothetical protein
VTVMSGIALASNLIDQLPDDGVGLKEKNELRSLLTGVRLRSSAEGEYERTSTSGACLDGSING